MGRMISKDGFTIDEIKENCSLFVNGHLHNGTEVDRGIINLGNITGQNFGEDAYTYSHNAMLLDTDTHEVRFIENPYAFNFYKLDVSNVPENGIKEMLSSLKNNAVVSISGRENQTCYINDLIKSMENIVASRVTVLYEESTEQHSIDRAETNHIEKFMNFVLETVGDTEMIREELLTVGGNI